MTTVLRSRLGGGAPLGGIGWVQRTTGAKVQDEGVAWTATKSVQSVANSGVQSCDEFSK